METPLRQSGAYFQSSVDNSDVFYGDVILYDSPPVLSYLAALVTPGGGNTPDFDTTTVPLPPPIDPTAFTITTPPTKYEWVFVPNPTCRALRVLTISSTQNARTILRQSKIRNPVAGEIEPAKLRRRMDLLNTVRFSTAEKAGNALYLLSVGHYVGVQVRLGENPIQVLRFSGTYAPYQVENTPSDPTRVAVTLYPSVWVLDTVPSPQLRTPFVCRQITGDAEQDGKLITWIAETVGENTLCAFDSPESIEESTTNSTKVPVHRRLPDM